MAINDIVAASGDSQEFIVEIPAGNTAFVPDDVLIESDGSLLCTEVPPVTDTGGNIFIMSE